MRYRCRCGYEAEETPSTPDREIVSVYHIHRRGDIRQPAEIVCMETVPGRPPARRDAPEPAGAVPA
jgi:hypothetical protein